jgi:hypothetical protein
LGSPQELPRLQVLLSDLSGSWLQEDTRRSMSLLLLLPAQQRQL